MSRVGIVAVAVSVALILGIVFGTIRPAGAQSCQSIEATISTINQTGGRYVVLSGDQLERAVRIYNEVPPVTDAEFDAGLFARHPDGRGFIVLGSGTMLCTHLEIPPSLVNEVIEEIVGEPA